MLLDIDHRSGVPIYRQVIDQIRRQILAGQLVEAERLMSVRELAERLRVNPMTISKAYSLLELEGLVERRRGVGLFVNKIRKDQKSKARTKLLEENLRKAVVTAVQFGVPREKVNEMVAKLYSQYKTKNRSDSDE